MFDASSGKIPSLHHTTTWNMDSQQILQSIP